MSTTIKGTAAIRGASPSPADVVAYLQAHAVFGDTPRLAALDRREAFFRCRQYAHQKIDWNGRNADQLESISADAIFPEGFVASSSNADGLFARDKRPTAPTNKARTIVRRYTGLLFSDKRKPEVVVEGDPDTEAMLEAIREVGKFWPQMRSARNLGGAMGSVAMTVHLRDGQFAYEVHNSKNLTPIWRDRRRWLLSGLLIMWRYQVTENVLDEKRRFAGTRQVDYIYRRIITETSDIKYRDVKLENAADGWEVEMEVDHDLGFFPGVWIQNTAESADMDGESDCEGAYQTIDTNDRLLSQCNYGALNNLDPTMVLAYDSKKVGAMGGGPGGVVAKGSDNSLHLGEGGHGDYMEMSGAGIEVSMKLSDRLEKNITDMTGAVFLDDKDMGATQSAKAIEFRFAPMLEVADDRRAQYGEATIQLMRVTERMARLFSAKSIPMQLPDGTAAIGKFDLGRFLPPRKLRVSRDGKMVDVIVGHKLGPGGFVTLRWGPYFAPTLDDNKATIANASAANASGFIAKETAAAPVAELYGVQDVAGEVAKAREEGTDEAERALAGEMGGVHASRALATGSETGDPTFGKSPAAGAGGKA